MAATYVVYIIIIINNSSYVVKLHNVIELPNEYSYRKLTTLTDKVNSKLQYLLTRRVCVCVYVRIIENSI